MKVVRKQRGVGSFGRNWEVIKKELFGGFRLLASPLRKVLHFFHKVGLKILG